MDKKFCDNCEKEIKDKWYLISVWEYKNGESEDDPKIEKEVCSVCYKKVNL